MFDHLFARRNAISRTGPQSACPGVKCVHFRVGMSWAELWAGSLQDLINWYCSLLARRTVCGSAAGTIQYKPIQNATKFWFQSAIKTLYNFLKQEDGQHFVVAGLKETLSWMLDLDVSLSMFSSHNNCSSSTYSLSVHAQLFHDIRTLVKLLYSV